MATNPAAWPARLPRHHHFHLRRLPLLLLRGLLRHWLASSSPCITLTLTPLLFPLVFPSWADPPLPQHVPHYIAYHEAATSLKQYESYTPTYMSSIN